MYGFILCFLLVAITHSSIFLATAQAKEDEGRVSYYLDTQTVEKGYSVKSADGQFTLLVFPGILSQESEVTLTTLYGSETMRYTYEFTIDSGGVAPLLKKPLSALFNAGKEKRYTYWRMYYYHKRSFVWLALSSRFNQQLGTLVSDRVDFSEGIIGIVGGDDPLPDRIGEPIWWMLPRDQSEDNGILREEFPDDANTFTLALGSDIIERGYTIRWREAMIAVPPLTLRVPSVVVIKWNKEEQLLDYNFRSLDGESPPLVKEAFITIKLFTEGGKESAKKIEFWDNNFKKWRDLPSSNDYRAETVTAKTPFHFGKYRVVKSAGVYMGEASWFKDSLISKTSMAAASNDFAIGTRVVVTNLNSGKQVTVEILSTGPYVDGRIIDLTYSAFAKIANTRQGTATVRVEASEQ